MPTTNTRLRLFADILQALGVRVLIQVHDGVELSFEENPPHVPQDDLIRIVYALGRELEMFGPREAAPEPAKRAGGLTPESSELVLASHRRVK